MHFYSKRQIKWNFDHFTKCQNIKFGANNFFCLFSFISKLINSLILMQSECYIYATSTVSQHINFIDFCSLILIILKVVHCWESGISLPKEAEQYIIESKSLGLPSIWIQKCWLGITIPNSHLWWTEMRTKLGIKVAALIKII